MQNVLTHIQNIEAKIKKLHVLYAAALKDNKDFIEINNKLTESLKQVSNEKKQLEQQYQMLLDAQKVRKEDDLSAYKKSVKKELDGYVRELDKCIELVKQS
jgi:hypothetical protein